MGLYRILVERRWDGTEYWLKEGGMVQNICREKTGQCKILFERRQDGIEYWLKEGGTVQNIG